MPLNPRAQAALGRFPVPFNDAWASTCRAA